MRKHCPALRVFQYQDFHHRLFQLLVRQLLPGVDTALRQEAIIKCQDRDARLDSWHMLFTCTTPSDTAFTPRSIREMVDIVLVYFGLSRATRIFRDYLWRKLLLVNVLIARRSFAVTEQIA